MKKWRFVAELIGDPINHDIVDSNLGIEFRGTRFPCAKFVFEASEELLKKMRVAIAHRKDVTPEDHPRKIVSLFFREVLLRTLPYSDVYVIEAGVSKDEEIMRWIPDDWDGEMQWSAKP